MKFARNIRAIAIGLATIGFATIAFAQDEEGAPADDMAEEGTLMKEGDTGGDGMGDDGMAGGAEEDEGAANMEISTDDAGDMSVNVEIEFASAYIWRGSSVFSAEQGRPSPVIFPSVGVAMGDLGFGYWGAFQVAGNKRDSSENNDAGLNTKVDLFVSYDMAINDDMGLSFGLTYHVYPVQKPDVGMYIEPAASVSYGVSGIDLGLGLSFFKGIAPKDNEGLDHLYIKPTVGKDLKINDTMSLGLGLGFGYKIFTGKVGGVSVSDGIKDSGGDIDLQVDAALNMTFDDIYVTPAGHFAWVNLEAGDDDPDTINIWGGVNVGMNF